MQSAWLSVQSSELVGSPHPLTRMKVLLSPLGPRGETHSQGGEALPFGFKGGDTLACGGGGGGPNSEGRHTLVLYVYYNPSTGKSMR